MIKRRKTNVRKIILNTIGTAGLLAAALVAPNAVSALAKIGVIPSRQKKNYVQNVFSKLVKEGYIVFDQETGRKFAKLSSKGQKIIDKINLDNFEISEPPLWDKKWRIVMFDINERKKKLRDELRLFLGRLGFERLQNSVWVYPYDCGELIALIKAHFMLGDEVLYITADNIENDQWLIDLFDLR
jgi:DNA-binding transcriptional regulator PaaX